MQTHKYKILPHIPDGRWQIIFQQGQAKGYQIGLYAPELCSAKKITHLEIHSGPEIFLLLQGEVSLVIRDTNNDPQSEEIILLQPGIPVLVFGYHNGFSPNQGTALVVEEMALQTNFCDYGKP